MSKASLLMTGRKRTLQTRSFSVGTSSWVCPASTYRLETVYGKGADGTPNYEAPNSTLIADVTYFSSGTGSTAGFNSWNNLDFRVGLALTAFNSGSGTYFDQFVICYPSSYTATNTSTSVPAGITPGTSTVSYGGAWTPGGGQVLANGTATINWTYTVTGTVGGDTTGFGYTFSGGLFMAATPSYQGPKLVTGGTSYSVTVPSGGFLTITYYE